MSIQQLDQSVNKFGTTKVGDFLNSHTSPDGSQLIDDPDIPTGKITITENGTDIDVYNYATADVNVPQPTGKVTITENGTDIDIAQYATADVNIAQNYSIDTEFTVSEGAMTAASVTLIGDVVVTIPDTVISIGNSVFAGNTLITKINIPVECVEFGTNVFQGCTSLTDIYYTGTQTEWEAITGLSGAGIPAGVTVHYTEIPSEETPSVGE